MARRRVEVHLEPSEEVKALKCSGSDMPKEMERIQQRLEQTADWKLRLSALKQLQGLVLGSHEVLRPMLPRCRDALLAQLQDLRSILVREACVTLKLMARRFACHFDFISLPALPLLVKGAQVTIQVIAESCQQCAVALVEQGGSSKLFEALTKLLREKRKGCSMELLAVALRCYDPSLLARHLDVVEEVLRNGLADANAAVRSQARACFHAFEEKFQERADRLLVRLDAQTQKQLRAGFSEPKTAPSGPRSKPRLQWKLESPSVGTPEEPETECGDEPEAEETSMEQDVHDALLAYLEGAEAIESVLAQLRSESLERQAELLQLLPLEEPGAKRQRAFDLLKACGEMRLECLEGQCLTDLLERLLDSDDALPVLQTLMEADATAFRAAAGDLCPGAFKVLCLLLPALKEKALPQPRVAWEKEGQKALVSALHGLTSGMEARTAALEALQDLLYHPQIADFAEVVASKLFQCHRNCLGEQQQQQTLRLLERLVASIGPLRALEMLLPVAEEQPQLGLALLPQGLRRLPPREASQHLKLILPALSQALTKEAASRKAAVMCLVELYLCIGEEAMEVFRQELMPSQVKLVSMYAERQRGPEKPVTSP